MSKNSWLHLSHLQLGKYGEYFAKMEFTKEGYDVYTAEVDDKGIDFLVRKNSHEYFDIQVKSVLKSKYVFMKKNIFELRKNLLLALVLFQENEPPSLLLIPSLKWEKNENSFLVDREYEGKKSTPEWGINITKSNLSTLKEKYAFDKQIKKLG